MENSSPSLGRFLLFGVLGFFIFLTIKNKGIVERTENTTILDGKASAKTYRELDQKERELTHRSPTPLKKKKKSYSKKEIESDDVLSDLAKAFARGRKETSRQMRDMGLSNDEIDYLNDVKETNSLSDAIGDARSWYKILKTSASTYSKVKSFVNDLGGSTESDVNVLLENSSSSNDFYKNLESAFGISESEARGFAKLGKRKVSDWAKFIEGRVE